MSSILGPGQDLGPSEDAGVKAQRASPLRIGRLIYAFVILVLTVLLVELAIMSATFLFTFGEEPTHVDVRDIHAMTVATIGGLLLGVSVGSVLAYKCLRNPKL